MAAASTVPELEGAAEEITPDEERAQEECIIMDDGRGVLLTHNEEDFTPRSKPLVEPHDVHMEKVEEEVTYTTVCLDNALRLPFLDQAQKLFSIACIKSTDCPLSFSSLGVPCDKLEKLGRVVIKHASRIVEKTKNSTYKSTLSQEAISELRSIEKITLSNQCKCPTSDIKCFLKKFGSHFIQGSLETTSSFEWAIIAESDCDAGFLFEIAEEVFEKCQQQPDVLEGSNSGMWYDVSSFLDTSGWKRKKKKVLRDCKLRVMHNNQMEQNMTFQKWLEWTTLTGTKQFPHMWKKSESVIKPVWTLIKEHSHEFQCPDHLVDSFEATWKKLVEETAHLEKQPTPIPVKIKFKETVFELRTTWENLLKDIGIEKYFPSKLSLQEVMALDCRSSKPSSWNEIAWEMLKRLIMIDNRFLEEPFIDYIDEMKNQQKIAYPHPMDIMLLLFHTSDFMLRQVLVKKLFMCRKAIPFIIPTQTDQLQIMLWPLRPIVLEWKNSDKAKEESLATYPISRVSFLKFGKSVFSKSNLVNDILSSNRHRVFMTNESRLVEAKRIISNGMVEMTHYSPAGNKKDDVLSEPMMVFNLRGDAIKFPSQEDILAKLSYVMVYIYDVTDVCRKDVQEKLKSTCTTKIIALLTNVTNLSGNSLDKILDEAEELLEDKKMEHVKMILGFNDEGINNNQMQLVHELRNAINAALPQVQKDSLENSLQLGLHKNIIDEISIKNCMEGKKLAEELMNAMKKVSKQERKETLLPLQEKVCKKMGSLLRKQHREKNHQEKEHVKREIEKLRREQNMKFKSERSFVKQYFLEPEIDDLTRLFFTNWLKMALDNECRSYLPQLQADYNMKWNELRKAKMTSDPNKIDPVQRACHSAEEKVAAACLGLEHVMREIGQIYEVCKDSQQQKELQKVAASFLMAGYPLEIMDGDNGYIPMQWITEVLNEVSRKVGTDSKVFVLSVLGVQSSGKSTLLNAMFGLEFTVSAGRCTRGIYAQMLPVNKKRSPQLPFDHLLVLDSEGLRAPELALQKFEHDNELATLVIGLADLTFINLKGENTAEIQDVLQIVVHAFLRMQRADSSTKRHCMFIHQNVSAINAETKMKHGQQKLEESLDEMTVQAAEALGLEKSFTSFHDVISFGGAEDTLYFPDLWSGEPPMATVKHNYSDKCLLVQRQILQKITKDSPACLKITDFTTRLQDLWNGVLAEDFVFSFRNSLAAKAYVSLEQQVAKYRRQIESTLLGWINKECHIGIEKCGTVQELNDCFINISTQLSVHIAQNAEKAMVDLNEFFDNHPQRDTLEQWKMDKLLSFKVGVESDTSQLEELLGELRDRKMVILKQQAQLHSHEGDIMRQAIELAEQMKGKKPADDELKRKFEEMWKVWSQDLRQQERQKGLPILSILHNILIDMFKHAGEFKFLYPQMEKHNPRSALEIPTLTKDDFEPKSKSVSKRIKDWWNQKGIVEECNETVKNIIMNQKVVIAGIVSQAVKFSNSHGREVLQSIFDKFAEVNSRSDDGAKFVLKPSVKAKVCLIVCDYAAEQFKKMNEDFESLYGVQAKMEAYKKKVFMMFQDTVNQRTTETNAAEYLCAAIRPNIEEIVNKDMSRKVVDLILQDIGHVKFHLMMRIMKSIAEQKNSASAFSSLQLYVNDAHSCARQWIQSHAESMLLFQSSECNTKYFGMAEEHVKKIIECVTESVTQASKENKTGIISWISSFCKHAEKELLITQNELKDLVNYKITNFETFRQLLEKRFSDLNTMISDKLAKVTKDSVRWNGPNPYTTATKKLWGCKKQCPFCSEPCQRADEDHDANHICVQHRPEGINGMSNIDTKVLSVDTCSMGVASDWLVTYREITGNDDMHPYKEYKKYYPQWDIAPDNAGDAAQYWKWIVCKFEKQIQEWYSSYKLEIPKSWHSVTEQQAMESLRVYNS